MLKSWDSQVSKFPDIDLIPHWTDGKYFHYSASPNNVINFDGNNEGSTLEQCPLSTLSMRITGMKEKKRPRSLLRVLIFLCHIIKGSANLQLSLPGCCHQCD